MKRAVDAAQAKQIDRYSIENGMPSLVLMERAAKAVADEIDKVCAGQGKENNSILAVCSAGNNGADGMAVLRILHANGYKCCAVIVGNEERATEEFRHQKRLLELLGICVIPFDRDIPNNLFTEYNIIVDAIFGIGLSRTVEGDYAKAAGFINSSGKYIVAVDIPSGVDASTGRILGCGVHANLTVTFGYAKLGQLLYPGKEYCGALAVHEVGFLPCGLSKEHTAYYFDGIGKYIPSREKRSNKGNYGKPVIIAGSQDMTGAAYMSGLAAYRTGSGVVTVLTHSSVDKYLKSVLPEAIVRSYDEDSLEQITDTLMKAASVIVLGPGIAVNSLSQRMVRFVSDNARVPVILDADALNVISGNVQEYFGGKRGNYPVIITPHVGEMARLTGLSAEQVAADIPGTALEFAEKYGVYCVLKDAVTAVASPVGELFLSTAGNPGMATAGSGDVLTGIMAAVMDWKAASADSIFHKSCLAVQIHGMAGDYAASGCGEHSLMARDIIAAIQSVLAD